MASDKQAANIETIGKGTIIVFLGVFIGSLLGYFTRIIMVRFFGAANYGLFSLGNAVLGVCIIICLFGIHQASIRFIPLYAARKNTKGVNSVMVSSFKILLPLSILFGSLIFIFSGHISSWLFQEPNLMPILQIFALALPFSVFTTEFVFCLKGFKQMKYVVLTDAILKNITTLFFIVVFFCIGLGIIGVIYAYLVGFILSSIVGFYFLKKSFPLLGKIKSIPMKRELLAFAWPLSLVGFLWIIVRWTDIIMLGFFNVSTQVGIYNMALPTAALLSMVMLSFTYIFIPIMSELYSKNQTKNMKQTFNTVSRWVFLITFPLFMIMVFFPGQIINLFFGQAYLAASMPLVILAIGYFVFSLGNIAGSSILVVGKTRINLVCTFIAALSNFILNLVLIPCFGIIGAAIATASSLIMFSAASFIFSYWHLGLQPFNLDYLKSMLCGVASVLLFYFITRLIFGTLVPGWALLTTFIGFLIFYAFLLLITRGIDKNDILILKLVEKKTGIKFKLLKRIIKRFV